MERFGEFILLEKVASGGMADIYKAVKVGARGFYKLLAVKRIKFHICQDKAFQDMFVKEAKVLSNLSHPNVASIYDLNRFNDQFYIVMEYIQGRDLHALIREHKMEGRVIPLDIALYIMTSLADGLEYIHNISDAEGTALHIVHRDINPKNIFLSFQGDVKIIDFGVARADIDSEETKTGVIKGKLSYLSPEQLEGRRINNQTDIFAAGLVFYEMLAGEKLFRGKTEAELLNTVMTLDIDERINELQAPDGLKSILRKSLARDMSERYLSAGELKAAVSRWEIENNISVSGQNLRRLMESRFRQDIEKEETENREHFTVLRRLAEKEELEDEDTVLLDKDETVLLTDEMLKDGTGGVDVKKEQDDRTILLDSGEPDIRKEEADSTTFKRFLTPPFIYIAAGMVLLLVIVSFFLLGRGREETLRPPGMSKEVDIPRHVEEPVTTPAVTEKQKETERPEPARVFTGREEDSKPPAGKAAGYIVFDGEPSGQQIYVDGELKGSLPATIELPAGFHEIRCAMDGFMPYKAGIRLRDGKVVNLKCNLKKE